MLPEPFASHMNTLIAIRRAKVGKRVPDPGPWLFPSQHPTDPPYPRPSPTGYNASASNPAPTAPAGASFARRGKVDAAVPLLQQALEIYERLDAARDRDRTQARLRGLGVRHGRRGARTRPQLGWESLTPTEHRVVELVAEGLSSPQIGERLYVSPRTVQTHLAHIFAKLGISSRAQLAAQATRRQPR